MVFLWFGGCFFTLILVFPVLLLSFSFSIIIFFLLIHAVVLGSFSQQYNFWANLTLEKIRRVWWIVTCIYLYFTTVMQCWVSNCLSVILIYSCWCSEQGDSRTAFVTFRDPKALEIALLLSVFYYLNSLSYPRSHYHVELVVLQWMSEVWFMLVYIWL